MDEVVESDDADDEQGKDDTEMGVDIRTNMDVDEGEEMLDTGLNAQEIDAYWLQRRISKEFDDIDANASQKLAEEVFIALQVLLVHMSILSPQPFAWIPAPGEGADGLHIHRKLTLERLRISWFPCWITTSLIS